MLSRENMPIRDRIHDERVIAERVRKCVLRYHQCLYVLGYEQTRIALCISQIVIYEIKFHGLRYTGCIRFVKSCRCIVLSSHSYCLYGLIGLAYRSTTYDRWSYSCQMSTWRRFYFPTVLYTFYQTEFYFVFLFFFFIKERLEKHEIFIRCLRKIFIFIVNAIQENFTKRSYNNLFMLDKKSSKISCLI